MNDLRQINLDDLRRRYLAGSDTAQARNLLNKFYQGKPLTVRVEGESVEVKLRPLLRHHEDGEIEDWETWLRDSFDQLLTAYGILEIACLSHLLPEPLPQGFAATALLHLSQPAVRRYYETHYKLLLPRLFRWRLEGVNHAHEQPNEVSAGLFMKFLDLHEFMETDPQIETFLWFLDVGIRYDVKSNDWPGLEDVLDVLDDEEAFFQTVIRKPTQASGLTLGVLGMKQFFWFCRELEQLLDQAEKYPLLQSAFWFLYEYWFGHLKRKVGGQLSHAVKQMEKWIGPTAKPDLEPSPLPAEAEAPNELWELPEASAAQGKPDNDRANWENRPTTTEMIATLKRLTGGEFRKPLQEVAAGCKRV